MRFIVPCSVVVLVNRWRVYLTFCSDNWSDDFNYIVRNASDSYDQRILYTITAHQPSFGKVMFSVVYLCHSICSQEGEVILYRTWALPL